MSPLTFGKQPLEKVRAVCSMVRICSCCPSHILAQHTCQMVEEFPMLCQYAGNWPICDMLRIYLKNKVQRAQE